MNVVVTGGTGGLGRAIVQALSGPDTHIVFTGRDSKTVKSLEKELSGRGDRARGLVCDLTDLKALAQLVEQAREEFSGTLDLLVNNAGVAVYGACDSITAKDFQTVFDTNVRGTMLLTSSLLPMLRQSGQGHVINISSVLGTQGIADAALYTASKHAIEGFSKVLRLEEGPAIRVTVIQPGAIDTGITRYVPRGGSTRSSAERLSPEEVARWVRHAAMAPATTRTDVIRLTPPGQML